MLSEHPDADGEPFDGRNCQFSHVPFSPKRDQMLCDIVHKRWTIRHIFYQLPLKFNLAFARVSTAAGYRHIYLCRDPVARAVSLTIAEQLDTWISSDATDTELDRCAHLAPVDVQRAAHLDRRARTMWHLIRPELRHMELAYYERLFIGSLEHRRRALWRLVQFLNLSPILWHRHRSEIDYLLMRGGQDSQRLRHLIPNMAELREALAP